MRVLVIDGDLDAAASIRDGLVGAGHHVFNSESGPDGLFKATSNAFDVIVLDRTIPGLDGLALVRALRAADNMTPVIFLTAMGSVAERVEGLESGADDYMVKPFAVSELAARVTALGRRPAYRSNTHALTAGDIVLDLDRRTVERAGQRVHLQPREFALLAELMRNPDRVMTRAILLERVWDLDFDPRTNIVETHLSRLRSKLNAGFDDDAITTVRGVGYVIRQK